MAATRAITAVWLPMDQTPLARKPSQNASGAKPADVKVKSSECTA